MNNEISTITNLGLNLENLEEGKVVINEMLDTMLSKSQNLLVVSADTRSEASDILAYAKEADKFFDKTRIKIKAPFLEKGKEIDSFFKQFDQVAQIIATSKNNIMAYDRKIEAGRIAEEKRLAEIQREIERKEKAEADRIAAIEKAEADRIAEEGNAAEAAKHAEEIAKRKEETAKHDAEMAKKNAELEEQKKKADALKSANTQFSGTGSKTTYRTETIYEITDKKKIPLKYMEPDMKKIKAALKSGLVTEIPGVKVTKDKVL